MRPLALLGKEDSVRLLGLLIAVVLLAGCKQGPTIDREIGYKGKARLDAYLAAERFLEHYDYAVESRPGWPKLDRGVAMVILPASVLSTEGYVREMSAWIADGGHMICLLDHAESHHDDWGRFVSSSDFRSDGISEPLTRWFTDSGITLSQGESTPLRSDEPIEISGTGYRVNAESRTGVSIHGEAKSVFSQTQYGSGLITVLADARPLRNRRIDENDHAAFLLALTRQSPFGGKIVVVRDAALSLGTLLWRHAWPVLVGVLAVTLFWLWKNMPRFGPLRREEERSTMRDYDHHLEALGDFQWRLDRGSAMLRPLRESVIERAQRLSAATQRGIDLFEWIAERSGITRERAERAMTHERPADATSFTRVLADLQKIHLSLS
jgi:hypothetical protein